MNICATCACAYRLIGFWFGVQFIASSFSTRYFLVPNGSILTVSVVAEWTLMALLAGGMWIFASRLARWTVGDGRSGIEPGIKMGCVYYLYTSLMSSLSIFLDWLLFYRTLEEPSYQVVYGLEERHAFTGISLVTFAALLLIVSKPLARSLDFSERLKEARESHDA
jgi:hypothetical protein